MADEAPHHPNGAALIEYYSTKEPDPEFADILEAVHRSMNRPVELLLPGVDDEVAAEAE